MGLYLKLPTVRHAIKAAIQLCEYTDAVSEVPDNNKFASNVKPPPVTFATSLDQDWATTLSTYIIINFEQTATFTYYFTLLIMEPTNEDPSSSGGDLPPGAEECYRTCLESELKYQADHAANGDLVNSVQRSEIANYTGPKPASLRGLHEQSIEWSELFTRPTQFDARLVALVQSILIRMKHLYLSAVEKGEDTEGLSGSNAVNSETLRDAALACAATDPDYETCQGIASYLKFAILDKEYEECMAMRLVALSCTAEHADYWLSQQALVFITIRMDQLVALKKVEWTQRTARAMVFGNGTTPPWKTAGPEHDDWTLELVARGEGHVLPRGIVPELPLDLLEGMKVPTGLRMPTNRRTFLPTQENCGPMNIVKKASPGDIQMHEDQKRSKKVVFDTLLQRFGLERPPTKKRNNKYRPRAPQQYRLVLCEEKAEETQSPYRFYDGGFDDPMTVGGLGSWEHFHRFPESDFEEEFGSGSGHTVYTPYPLTTRTTQDAILQGLRLSLQAARLREAEESRQAESGSSLEALRNQQPVSTATKRKRKRPTKNSKKTTNTDHAREVEEISSDADGVLDRGKAKKAIAATGHCFTSQPLPAAGQFTALDLETMSMDEMERQFALLSAANEELKQKTATLEASLGRIEPALETVKRNNAAMEASLSPEGHAHLAGLRQARAEGRTAPMSMAELQDSFEENKQWLARFTAERDEPVVADEEDIKLHAAWLERVTGWWQPEAHEPGAVKPEGWKADPMTQADREYA